jgi:hypothetical protein
MKFQDNVMAVRFVEYFIQAVTGFCIIWITGTLL